MVNINNGMISMNRGDTFYMPLIINMGTKFAPEYYHITEADTVYLGIMSQNTRWERAIIKKVFDIENTDADGNVIISLDSIDTEYLLPGTYYYEIKLEHIHVDAEEQEHAYIDTIVPRRPFLILE